MSLSFLLLAWISVSLCDPTLDGNPLPKEISTIERKYQLLSEKRHQKFLQVVELAYQRKLQIIELQEENQELKHQVNELQQALPVDIRQQLLDSHAQKSKQTSAIPKELIVILSLAAFISSCVVGICRISISFSSQQEPHGPIDRVMLSQAVIDDINISIDTDSDSLTIHNYGYRDIDFSNSCIQCATDKASIKRSFQFPQGFMIASQTRLCLTSQSTNAVHPPKPRRSLAKRRISQELDTPRDLSTVPALDSRLCPTIQWASTWVWTEGTYAILLDAAKTELFSGEPSGHAHFS